MAFQDSPLVTALPPETDYISYLTIVEQYLTVDTLPILHKNLQDETLTTSIGWDLVHVLVPMLPASEDCLQTIARLGNPREVILKVTEALRLIEFQRDDVVDEEEDTPVSAKPRLTLQTQDPPLPSHVVQFDTLLSMLTTLHARIKTKYPSRFLSATLQAVLVSFSNASDHKEDMLLSIIQMVKKMRGISRPALPSRASSGTLQRVVSASADTKAAARDPEATSSQAEPEETAIQLKLFQAFLTHVLEEFMFTIPAYEELPALAWSSRVMETLHKERTIPHSKTVISRFHDDPVLQARNDAAGSLISLASDLRITDEDLLAASTTSEVAGANLLDDDEPPSSAADIPLSKPGSTLLYAARRVSDVLYGRPERQLTGFHIFPQHQAMLDVALTAGSSGADTFGTEPAALIDAVLVLGLLALDHDNIGSPQDDTQFQQYLQMTALLASNCPNSNLRGHAHYLVSTILRSHPEAKIRYGFIKDTLEHCPYENLRTVAVGWLKGEIIEANLSPDPETSTLFSSSITLEGLAPYLFPQLRSDLVEAPLLVAWTTFQTNVSFYLAVLNFLYLMITSAPIRQALDVTDIWTEHKIDASFIQPLLDAASRFTKDVASGNGEIEYLTDGEKGQILAELNVVNETIGRVKEAAKVFHS